MFFLSFYTYLPTYKKYVWSCFDAWLNLLWIIFHLGSGHVQKQMLSDRTPIMFPCPITIFFLLKENLVVLSHMSAASFPPIIFKFGWDVIFTKEERTIQKLTVRERERESVVIECKYNVCVLRFVFFLFLSAFEPTIVFKLMFLFSLLFCWKFVCVVVHRPRRRRRSRCCHFPLYFFKLYLFQVFSSHKTKQWMKICKKGQERDMSGTFIQRKVELNRFNDLYYCFTKTNLIYYFFFFCFLLEGATDHCCFFIYYPHFCLSACKLSWAVGRIQSGTSIANSH